MASRAVDHASVSVSWSVSSTLKTEDLPLQALDIAVRNVSDNLTGLVQHLDRGSNSASLTYTDRIVELGGGAPTARGD